MGKKEEVLKEITAHEVIDMNQEEFESFVKDCKMTVGDASNLSFFLSSIYQRTTLEKDAILMKIDKNEILKSEVEKHLQDMYLLLMDIENKVIFLNNYIKETM